LKLGKKHYFNGGGSPGTVGFPLLPGPVDLIINGCPRNSQVLCRFQVMNFGKFGLLQLGCILKPPWK